LAAAYLDHCRAKGLRDLRFAHTCVARLKQHFGGWRANRITPDAIATYIARRQVEGYALGKDGEQRRCYANGTINRDLATLRRILRLGRQAGKVLLVPQFEMLREAAPRQGFLSDVDFVALEAQLRDDLRLPISFKYTYGWRKAAVFSLTWDKLNLREGTVELDRRYSKNGEPVLVYLTEELWARFRAQWEATCKLVLKRTPGVTPQQVRETVPWVFHRHGKRIGRFDRAWKRACKAIGRGELTPHDLRRSAARRMDRLGIPRTVQMQLAGWRTDSIYRRYRIVDEQDLREAAAKLGAGPFAFSLPPGAREAAPASRPSRTSQECKWLILRGRAFCSAGARSCGKGHV
ncbi:MAG: tyrosine-type recombinase/integrase, partial [Gemmatimonadales bacterium]